MTYDKISFRSVDAECDAWHFPAADDSLAIAAGSYRSPTSTAALPPNRRPRRRSRAGPRCGTTRATTSTPKSASPGTSRPSPPGLVPTPRPAPRLTGARIVVHPIRTIYGAVADG
jgi:hypothetical protein